MTSNSDKDVQLAVTGDASSVLSTFDKVKQGAAGMAQEVSKSGESAGKGLEKAGDGAQKGADKIDKSTKSIIQSIERATAAAQAGERGTAAYFEAIAKGRGVNADALKPYLEQLRQAEAAQRLAEGSLQNMGNSAKQTVAALRQVPAQFTDIAVSLQGGQNPLTVLLQQGGQLKDVFGGIGPAARAMGGYVLGLVNPFTLAAGAAGLLAYGFFKGAEESQAFNKALVLTGNAAGTTVNQLSAMAARMDGLGTTQARASEGLLAFVNAGVKGAAGLERYTLAAIKLEEVGGPAVAETAKAFADLGKDPLKAALKLDEATNFLTTSTYAQIKALEEQGRSVDAAKVAQDAYAQAIEGQAPQILEKLGAIERAWFNIKKGAAEAADNAIFSIGRKESLQQQLASAQNRKSAAQFDFRQANSNGGGGLLGRFQAGRALDRERQADADIADLNRRLLKEAEVTAEVRTQNALKAATFEADKILSGLADKKAKQAIEEARVRAVLTEAGKSDLEIQKALAAVREKYADKKADTAATRELEKQQKLLAELNGLSGTFYEDWDRLNALFKGGVIKSVERLTELQGSLLKDQPFQKGINKETEEQFKEALKIAEQRIDLRRKEEAAIKAELDGRKAADEAAATSIRGRITGLSEENQALELSREKNISLAQAVNDLALARLRDKLAAAKDSGGDTSEIERQIALYQRLGQEIGRNEINKFLDPDKAKSFGDALTKAFDGAGNALTRMVSLLESAGEKSRFNDRAQKSIDAETDAVKKLAAQRLLNNKRQSESVSLYADLAGTAKGFFDEGTKGYKALEIAETAFRAYQLASDFQKGVSAATVGVANQAQGDPYTAVPRMIAMAATMASLGYQVAGIANSGGSTGGDGAKQATGTGTVFGDASAKSESIANSIDLLADTSKLQLTTQSGMLAALRNIENNIGGVTNQILRINAGSSPAERLGITTGTSGPNALGKGLTGGSLNLDNILFGGKLTNALFGKNTKVTGSGLFSGAQDLGSVLASGLNLKDFADVNESRKFFGIKVSNKNSTTYQDADAGLQRQFSQIFKDFASTLTLAAGPLELALDDVNSRINGFIIDIGKIDLTGLKGDEIAEKLGAVIGAEGDKIAAAAIPGLVDFQRVGEGYFETVVRVASGVETADAALELLGIGAIKFGDVVRKQGDVATEIVRQSIAAFESLDGSLSSIGAIVSTLDGSADDLTQTYGALLDVRDALLSVGESGDTLTAIMIRGAGGLDNLSGSLSSYFENFFSDEEQASARLARLSEDFAKIGITTIPQTREEFRKLVEGIDTSTDAGQKFFAQVIGLAGAFADAVPAAQALETAVKTLDYVMTEQGRFDAKKFSAEVAGITAQDIQANILERSGADRDRAQANFDVGSATFLGAYANSLAAQRLAFKEPPNPVPVYGGSSGSAGRDPGEDLRQKEVDALRSLTDAMRSLDEQIGGFIDSQTIGSDSFLSPEQRFFESKAAFESTIRQAGAGDQAAAELVQSRASAFADATKAYFGSSQAGTDNLAAMVAQLQGLREQVRSLLGAAEAGNRISATGFSEVSEATEESSAATNQALARIRLRAQKSVGFEA